MKRFIAIILTVGLAGVAALAQQTGSAPAQPTAGAQQQHGPEPAQNQPTQSQPAPSQPAQGQATQQPAPGAAAQPAGKPQPQAKSQEEFQAYQAAGSKTDPTEAEAAATDFATKYPQSELKVFLFRRLMYIYQSANNADKTLDIAKKILAMDPNNPEALVTSAMVLSERTRETDLDKDERLKEAKGYAQKALTTIDTDLFVPAGSDPAQVEQVKNVLKSMADLAIGTADYINKDYAAATPTLQKATELNPKDPVAWLRLSVVLDNQKKYPEAMAAISKALEVAPPNSPEANMAKSEQDRLQKLSAGTTPAAPKQ